MKLHASDCQWALHMQWWSKRHTLDFCHNYDLSIKAHVREKTGCIPGPGSSNDTQWYNTE